jgi:hypothetical protein
MLPKPDQSDNDRRVTEGLATEYGWWRGEECFWVRDAEHLLQRHVTLDGMQGKGQHDL